MWLIRPSHPVRHLIFLRKAVGARARAVPRRACWRVGWPRSARPARGAHVRRWRSHSRDRRLIARCSRALRCPLTRCSVRLALRTTAAESRIAAPAMSPDSPVSRRTAVCASSLPAALRSRGLLAIDRARRPAAQRRSRDRVRVAPPALIRATVRAIVPTALASSPESVGKPPAPQPQWCRPAPVGTQQLRRGGRGK